MNTSIENINVKSHVSRDLLQSASLFKTDKLVIWEYVSNGLQYIEPGLSSCVRVTLEAKKKRICIQDNGRGMSWKGLQNFFIMHGENQDRREGRGGRGRFGTGKSAAFGIADTLRVTTIHNGKRCQVELHRSDMISPEDVPVRTIESDVPTSESNGTKIEIENIHLRSLDQKGSIAYIERHLARWPKDAVVFVNQHQCEFAEPAISEVQKIKPGNATAETLGNVELTIKIARAPLEEDLRGVAIYANNVWMETTLAGSENREMSQYIFGEIDVPRLDQDTSPISPYDMSRSMQLNPNNALVQSIYSFINQHIEVARKKLVDAERKRKTSEEAKKLDQQASEIARVINEDFNDYRQRVAKAKARLGTEINADEWQNAQGENEKVFLHGGDIPADLVSDEGAPGSNGEGQIINQEEPRLLQPIVEPGSENSIHQGHPAGEENATEEHKNTKARTSNGFNIKFNNLGENEPRAKYARDERTIFINLDHPQFAAAQLLSSTEDIAFRRLSYEVAFAEYAIALSVELAARGEYLDPSDPIYDIHETLNRVARKGAALYAK